MFLGYPDLKDSFWEGEGIGLSPPKKRGCLFSWDLESLVCLLGNSLHLSYAPASSSHASAVGCFTPLWAKVT